MPSLKRSGTVSTWQATTMSDRRYGADEHNADYERGRDDERAAIAEWLSNWMFLNSLAKSIEHCEHLRGKDA